MGWVVGLNLLVSAGVMIYWAPRFSELFGYIDIVLAFVGFELACADRIGSGRIAGSHTAGHSLDCVRGQRVPVGQRPDLHAHVPHNAADVAQASILLLTIARATSAMTALAFWEGRSSTPCSRLS